MSTDLVKDVIDAAKEIMESIDNSDAYSFAESIKEKAASIGETIESMEKRGLQASERQIAALQNMLNGAERWLENVK